MEEDHSVGTKELKSAFLNANLHEGDVIFVDRDLVDIKSLLRLPWPADLPKKIVIIPIQRRQDETLAEAILTMPMHEAKLLLEKLTSMPLGNEAA
jgi:hypothetical protein